MNFASRLCYANNVFSGVKALRLQPLSLRQFNSGNGSLRASMRQRLERIRQHSDNRTPFSRTQTICKSDNSQDYFIHGIIFDNMGSRFLQLRNFHAQQILLLVVLGFCFNHVPPLLCNPFERTLFQISLLIVMVAILFQF